MVPGDDIFHEADSLAFGGIRKDKVWFARFWNSLKRLSQLIEVVTIDRLDAPAEASELFVDRFVTAHIACWSGDLE